MKSFKLLVSFIFLISTTFLLNAQTANEVNATVFDYKEYKLNNTDTIPEFSSKDNKIKISGIIYKSDGVTPASDVVLYIEQANELGDFDLRKENGEKYVYHNASIKTNENGEYTFYTFLPGNDRRYNQLQQLFPTITEPSKEPYQIASFLFDDDPLLTKRCRKQIAKKSDPSRILELKKEGKLLVARKDIVLDFSDCSSK